MKIALTGGIACGKSLFAKFLRELGIQVIDADDVVHELESPGGAAVPAIAARFGSRILAPDGGVDRPALGSLVFSDNTARADLEAILLPMVRERLTSCSGEDLTIHVIPLLFESHWETDYDIILCIASSVEKQIDRMMTTRGYSRSHAEARLAAQWPVAEKAARCHYTVMNDSTPEHLRDEAMRLAAWLKERMENECRRREEIACGGPSSA